MFAALCFQKQIWIPTDWVQNYTKELQANTIKVILKEEPSKHQWTFYEFLEVGFHD